MRNLSVIGSVGEIWRYPVKSMLGETLSVVDVQTRGLSGDRICAFTDTETGKVASAKLPHRWQALLTCSATVREGSVSIVLPDGRSASPQEAEAILSNLLGRPLRATFDRAEGLEVDRADPDEVSEQGSSSTLNYEVMHVGMGAPEGGFFDALPIHFVTDLSLAAAAACAAVGAVGAKEAARFRPNIVITSAGNAPFEENGWVGNTLIIGDTVQIAVTFPTPRCAVPALRHGAIDPDFQIIRRLALLNEVPVLNIGNKICLGAYGKVLTPGCVRKGDIVTLRSA